MLAALGDWVSSVFRRLAPDPFVLAVLLTVLTAALALTIGFPPEDGVAREALGTRAALLLDAWRADAGLWKFLAFGMQMCLILVTGHAVASSKPVRAGLTALAALPRTGRQAVLLVGVVAALAGLVNWGLGLIVGALLARDVGRACAARGVAVHPPILAAAGYLAMMVWHGGLSGSAPITMTTAEGAAKVLPASALESFKDGMPLTQTLFSPMNLCITGGLVLLAPIVLALMTPKRSRDAGDAMSPPASDTLAGEPHPGATEEGAIPRWLETSPFIPWVLSAALIAAVVRYGLDMGLARVGLNEINAAMLALGLILHGSARSYVAAVEEGARGCAGVILQFPLYAGIMAMMVASGLVTMIAGGMASAGGASMAPVMTFISAGVVNLFVPSGGGQWGIQGPIALQSGVAAGVDPAKMVMAVAYGDQLTNMLQPFWALPLLAITGQKARDIVGYTAIVMLVGGAWVTLGLIVF